MEKGVGKWNRETLNPHIILKLKTATDKHEQKSKKKKEKIKQQWKKKTDETPWSVRRFQNPKKNNFVESEKMQNNMRFTLNWTRQKRAISYQTLDTPRTHMFWCYNRCNDKRREDSIALISLGDSAGWVIPQTRDNSCTLRAFLGTDWKENSQPSELNPNDFVSGRHGACDMVSPKAMLHGLGNAEGGRAALPLVSMFYGAPSKYLWGDDPGNVQNTTGWRVAAHCRDTRSHSSCCGEHPCCHTQRFNVLCTLWAIQSTRHGPPTLLDRTLPSPGPWCTCTRLAQCGISVQRTIKRCGSVCARSCEYHQPSPRTSES